MMEKMYFLKKIHFFLYDKKNRTTILKRRGLQVKLEPFPC
jgi:hypothetical protein